MSQHNTTTSFSLGKNCKMVESDTFTIQPKLEFLRPSHTAFAHFNLGTSCPHQRDTNIQLSHGQLQVMEP